MHCISNTYSGHLRDPGGIRYPLLYRQRRATKHFPSSSGLFLSLVHVVPQGFREARSSTRYLLIGSLTRGLAPTPRRLISGSPKSNEYELRYIRKHVLVIDPRSITSLYHHVHHSQAYQYPPPNPVAASCCCQWPGNLLGSG
jgi:hypothetical protein